MRRFETETNRTAIFEGLLGQLWWAVSDERSVIGLTKNGWLSKTVNKKVVQIAVLCGLQVSVHFAYRRPKCFFAQLGLFLVEQQQNVQSNLAKSRIADLSPYLQLRTDSSDLDLI